MYNMNISTYVHRYILYVQVPVCTICTYVHMYMCTYAYIMYIMYTCTYVHMYIFDIICTICTDGSWQSARKLAGGRIF